MAIDKTGQTIGNLFLSRRKRENGRTYYYCECGICGNKKWIRSDYVKKSESCGCLAEQTQFQPTDHLNKRYGRLLVVKKLREGLWECECSCGKICEKTSKQLSSNRVKSCGCLRLEAVRPNVKKATKKFKEKYIVEGTNIAAISRNTPISTNTSGVTGVKWDKSRRKWVATIVFKKKTYYLGRYDEKEHAIFARREAEKHTHKRFLEWYEEKGTNK